MGDKIYVPYQEAESEFVEKRSRFIGHVWPVDSEDQAQELLRRVKKQHYDARHNCWCYLLGGSVVRYSDDGEPQGTAGQPMLAVFQREHVTNVLCVVTRYFGGILLGAGGLTRAYSKSARDALAAAGVAAMGLWTAARCTCPYPLLERVKLEVQAVGGTVDAVDYGAEAALTLSLPEDAPRRLQDRLTELSAGRLRLELSGPVSGGSPSALQPLLPLRRLGVRRPLQREPGPVCALRPAYLPPLRPSRPPRQSILYCMRRTSI